jgi:hypothetical protein
MRTPRLSSSQKLHARRSSSEELQFSGWHLELRLAAIQTHNDIWEYKNRRLLEALHSLVMNHNLGTK